LRVTYGLLNLAHRNSHEVPEPLEPGKRYRVQVQLCDIAHAFPTGHRVRVAISTSYWPIAWPSPAPVALTVYAGTGHLQLPARPPRAEDANLRPFPPAEAAPALPMIEHRADAINETVTQDLITGETIFTTDEDHGHYTIEPIGLDVEHDKREVFRVADDEPTSAVADIAYRRRVSRGAWRTRTETHTVMRATASEFVVEATLDAYEGETRILSRNWQVRHKRDFV
jgi:hypothetical protein